MIARGLTEDAIQVIRDVAASIRDGLDATPGQRRNCLRACSDWTRALSERGIDVQVIGGEGVDDDVFTSDRRLVRLDERSGYREDDDQVHRHYWLGIGSERLIFDPTAHQFDDKGDVALDRYTIDSMPAISSRTPWQRGRAARTSGW